MARYPNTPRLDVRIRPEDVQPNERRQQGDLRGSGLLPPELEEEQARLDLRGSGLLPPELEEEQARQRGDLRGTGLLPPGFGDLPTPDPGAFNNPGVPGLGLTPITPAQPPANAIDQVPGANTRRSETDKKRRITISRNQLDPLSAWYHSRAKYGNYNNITFSNPGVNDDRLKINYRNIDGLDNPSNPDFQWSLARLKGLAEPARHTTIENVTTFLHAINSDNVDQGEYYKNLYRSGNPFIFVDKRVEGSSDVYRSMPSEMLEAVLVTSDRILDVLSLFSLGDPIPLQRELEQAAVRQFVQRNPPIQAYEEDPQVTSFFDSLIRSGRSVRFGRGTFQQDLIDYRQDIRISVSETGQSRTLLSIIDDVLNLIVTNNDISENTVRLCRYLVVTAFLPVVSGGIILRALQDSPGYDRSHNYVEIDTPYITTRNTYNYLKDDVSPRFIASLKSEYNFYAKTYEEVSLEFEEQNLPNVYLLNNYLELDSIQARSPSQETQYNILGRYLSLFEAFSNVSSLSRLESEYYYNAYAKALPSVTSENLINLSLAQASIIIDSDQLKNTQVFNNVPPMSLGVRFHRASSALMNDILRDLDLPDFRETMFNNIIGDQDDSRVPTLYSTEYLVQGARGVYEIESDFMATSLRQFDFVNLIDTLSRPGVKKSLVIGDNTEETSADLLGVLEEGVHSRAQQYARQGAVDIINGNDSKSVALGYRLAKKTDDIGIQNFYLGNGEGTRDVIYTDSQVKYGDEYSYELFEYRLLFGTKYKFNALGADFARGSTIPSWVFEYYLGLATPTNAQIEDFRPNISFSCWLEPTADYSVVEVPIYAESILPENVSTNSAPIRRDNRFDLDIGGLNLGDLSALNRTALIESITYPVGKVLDYPPTPPILDIFPLVNNNRQVKISTNIQTGALLGDDALEIVSIGDATEQVRMMKEYQDNFNDFFLAPNEMEFKNEGLREIKNIRLYRTDDINLNVENYNDIYKSFDPLINNSVVVRSYSTDPTDETSEQVLSYDILENIRSNVNYYYTTVVEDVHGNVSNPSTIYRVRLLFDKGLVIPEIDTVLPLGVNKKMPSKNLTQLVRISASDIQSLPIISEAGQSQRSLGKLLGKSIEDKSYVVRFTSKDTGRKFDLKLNFVIRVDGDAINIGT